MPTTDLHPRATAVLNFWFGAPGSPEHGTNRAEWFKKDDAFDQMIIERHMSDYEKAAAGGHDDWAQTARGSLALLVLLDQFPRNMFRNDAKSFATDDKALQIACAMVDRGDDKGFSKDEQFFVYLPFEHAEDIAMQERCLKLTAAMPQGKAENSPYHWAKQHHDVIAQFGRFPHRNSVLGRINTPEEDAYLNKPGAGF
ncbi:MAG: DUF924 family protein [Alphaproteobacteria bacterium]|nr:DUF924 family protein [Alphaproteobacteria bacterium]